MNEAAVVKWGAPAGLVCVGLVAIGSRMAWLREHRADEPGEAPAEPDTDAAPAGAS
jgi:hypothetical protein